MLRILCFPCETNSIGKKSFTSPMPQSCIPNDATVLKSIGMRILYFSFEVPLIQRRPEICVVRVQKWSAKWRPRCTCVAHARRAGSKKKERQREINHERNTFASRFFFLSQKRDEPWHDRPTHHQYVRACMYRNLWHRS